VHLEPAVTDRPRRADAERNRQRLLEVAVQAFAHGAADVSLEGIAREAGVGIGTLYRHFPTREALIEAAYRSELARVCDSADELLATSAPEAALRAWMGAFVGYMATKRGMAHALRAVVAAGTNPFEQSRARLLAAVTALMQAGVAAGTVRADVAPADVLTSLAGLSLTAAEPGQRDRLLDLLIDGLRRRA
jgi:AcrR family transcriptional regulator